jgi:predicted tellurium resistance membrane protein TerC
LTELTHIHTWISLGVLTLLEIILGGDNIVFISLASTRLPLHQQAFARRLGLLLAMLMRLSMLAVAFYLSQLTKPLLHIGNFGLSVQNIIFICGGGFLLYTAVEEIITTRYTSIHKKIKTVRSTFLCVITQIVLLDIVFSLDSIFTAIAIAKVYWIMATAIVISVIIMLIASDYLSRLIQDNPQIKILAICFVLLIGVFLLLSGLHIDLPHHMIYVALGFSIFVQIIMQYCLAETLSTKK